MRCIVINLPDATERRAHTKAQFELASLPYELWPAIDARSLSQEQMGTVDQRERAARTLRPMNAPQLACLLSHMAVLREIAEGVNDMTAVFEDDAVLHVELPGFLEALEGKADKFDICMLHRNLPSTPYVPVYSVLHSHTIGRLKYSNYGAYGYVITRRAACNILNRFPRPTFESDWLLPRFWINGLDRVFWANPPLVSHTSNLPSQINLPKTGHRFAHWWRAMANDPLLVLRHIRKNFRQNLECRLQWRKLREQDLSINFHSF